jgi:ribosomal protein L37AE/L43A
MNNKVLEVLPSERVAAPSPSCPLCHTADAGISTEAVAAGGSWKCVRCGQRWDTGRLETAAAYARSFTVRR